MGYTTRGQKQQHSSNRWEWHTLRTHIGGLGQLGQHRRGHRVNVRLTFGSGPPVMSWLALPLRTGAPLDITGVEVLAALKPELGTIPIVRPVPAPSMPSAGDEGPAIPLLRIITPWGSPGPRLEPKPTKLFGTKAGAPPLLCCAPLADAALIICGCCGPGCCWGMTPVCCSPPWALPAENFFATSCSLASSVLLSRYSSCTAQDV